MINFTKSTIKKVIISLLIFMMISNYILPKVVFAEDDDDKTSKSGGVLLKPFFDFIVFLDDSILSILQGSFIISEPITIEGEVDGTISGKSIGMVLAGAISITGSVLLVPVTGGSSSAIATWVGGKLLSGAFWTGSVSVIVGTYTRH